MSNAPRVALIDAKSVTSFEMNVDMALSHYIEEVVEPTPGALGIHLGSGSIYIEAEEIDIKLLG